MPITQDRMKLLLEAAQGVEATYLTAIGAIAAAHFKLIKGKITVADFSDEIELYLIRPEAAIAPEHNIIDREQTRWQYTHSRNAQEARRLAGKREAERLGLPPPENKRQENKRLKLTDSQRAEFEQQAESELETLIPGELPASSKAEIDAMLAGMGEDSSGD